ncbi:MAG TPA: DUF2064 domain-containing protein, partial [Thermoleophilia bacterium]|nr:DUF2064 domain-containing protein [Thermoleophilia bacterium]
MDHDEDDHEMRRATQAGRVNASESPSIPAGGRVLVVMAKPLVRGAVKTRLAQELGPDEALAVYAGLLEGTLWQAEMLGDVSLVLALAEQTDGPGPGPAQDAGAGGGGRDAAAPSDPLAGRDRQWLRLAQRGPTLGERLAGVFEDLFAGGAGLVVIVNSDSPPIPLEYLEQALGALDGDRQDVGGGHDEAGTGREDTGGNRRNDSAPLV